MVYARKLVALRMVLLVRAYSRCAASKRQMVIGMAWIEYFLVVILR